MENSKCTFKCHTGFENCTQTQLKMQLLQLCSGCQKKFNHVACDLVNRTANKGFCCKHKQYAIWFCIWNEENTHTHRVYAKLGACTLYGKCGDNQIYATVFCLESIEKCVQNLFLMLLNACNYNDLCNDWEKEEYDARAFTKKAIQLQDHVFVCVSVECFMCARTVVQSLRLLKMWWIWMQ